MSPDQEVRAAALAAASRAVVGYPGHPTHALAAALKYAPRYEAFILTGTDPGPDEP